MWGMSDVEGTWEGVMDIHDLRNHLGRLIAAVLCLTAPSVSGFAADPAPDLSSGSPVIGTKSAPLVPVFDGALNQERLVRPAEAARIIRKYWTLQRMAAAIPVAVKGQGSEAAGTQSPQSEGVARDIAVPKALKRAKITPEAVTSYTEGKVFFVAPNGQPYQCSGGAVNSPKRRLVWTAGHCVHTGPGDDYPGPKGWMTNWVFVPGYDYASRPQGTFPYYQLWTKTAWINSRDLHYDYGVAITWNNEFGWRVVDRVGGNGLTINPGRPFVIAIGYPSNFFGGEAQSYCQGWLSRRSIFNSDQKLNCARAEGASGEPWLRDYSGGLGYIVSNASHYSGSYPPVYGPYYDDATASLYHTAENASP